MINNNKVEQEKTVVNPSLKDKLQEYFYTTKHTKSNKASKIDLFMDEYISRFYRDVKIDSLDDEVFERMLIQFIPMRILDINYREIDQLLNEWNYFLGFIKKHYNINVIDKYKKVYNNNYKELQRINYISKEIRKFTEEPVILWDPLVIDFNCYVRFKKNKELNNKHILYDQGYYTVFELISDQVILKKLGGADFVKIKLDSLLIQEVRKNDIIHMRIKKKIFCSSWEIIKVKGYYNNKVGKYLNLGGIS